jgi:PIN domain nuclease of toxin-antitoxin system
MYLLDAHVLIWHKDDDPRLPAHVSDLIESSEEVLWVSVITWWEMMIKEGKGALRIKRRCCGSPYRFH